MNLEMGLFQQQTMKLVMTQQLRQAISLLQYSSLELSEYIEDQALENPLLEVLESKNDEPLIPDAPVLWRDRDESSGEGGSESFMEQIKADRSDLTSLLFGQLHHVNVDERTYHNLVYLIYNIDEQGYLQVDAEKSANEAGMTEEEYDAAHFILQGFDPIGVGARSLSESLLLQMRELPEEFLLAELVVEYYLQPFAEKKWKALSEELEVSMKELQDVQDYIQQLNPWPAQGIGGEQPKFISPDVYVVWEDGKWAVQLNDDSLPRIRLNRQYRSLLEQKGGTADKEAFDYAHQKYKQLVWLLKSIDQRQQTVRLVTEAIVEFQQEFFETGVLKPMTLRHIANMADVHESTVSRTTTSKYMQTPRGCFELKSFFSKGLANAGGEETSSTVLKKAIQQWIEAEDKSKPLSDQKITDRFHSEQGVKVSRRAIAKYRDELKIPASSKRKRFA